MTTLPEILVIALTLWGEARGEPQAGKEAVAAVIWNRAQAQRKLPAPICLQPYQFSCWDHGGADPEIAAKRLMSDVLMALGNNIDKKEWEACFKLAMTIYVAQTQPEKFEPAGPWTHFHSATSTPGWAAKMVDRVMIGKQVFMREDK